MLLPCQGVPALDVIEDALVTAVPPQGELRLLRRLPAARPGWFLGDPSLVYRWTPSLDADGPVHPPMTLLVDAPSRRLPGVDTDEDTAAAYALGAFGPGAVPGGLVRAAATTPEWSEAAGVVDAHTAVLRSRLSYAIGGGGHADPPGRDRDLELAVLSALASPLLELGEVLGWFHAPGERLCSRAAVRRALAHAAEDGRVPVELWTHLRAFAVGDPDGWVLYDTVGMPSLGARDLELAARADRLSGADAAVFLRNLSLYALARADPFKSGHTTESPVGRLRARVLGRGLRAPARRVVRWAPMGGRPLPLSLER